MKKAKKKTQVEETLAQRGPKYGPFIEQAAVSQTLKRVMWLTPGWDKLAYDQREAFEMIAMKISRALCGDPNYIDNFVDVAGYSTLVANRLTQEYGDAQ